MKALNNRFYLKFMQLGIDLLLTKIKISNTNNFASMIGQCI